MAMAREDLGSEEGLKYLTPRYGGTARAWLFGYLSESRYFCGAGKGIMNVWPTVSASKTGRLCCWSSCYRVAQCCNGWLMGAKFAT